MSVMRGLLAAVTVGALTFPATPPNKNLFRTESTHTRAAAKSAPIATSLYKANQLEFYLTDAAVNWIRPGLNIKVNSVKIGTDRKPVVDYSITDSLGQPIDRLGVATPGVVSPSFILSVWNPTTREYTPITTRVQTTPANSPHPGVSQVQGGTDSGGTPVDLELGHATYTFKTTLPASFDASKTYTLGMYATRNMTDTLGKSYIKNVEFDFRPDGGTVTDKWDEINQATSCNNCHDPAVGLNAHGGSRQDVKLCVLCHNSTNIDPDTGNNTDFKQMIHKIHMGEHLPSVQAGTPYQIIGFGQGVNDFSDVALPQDIRNCANCHEGTDATKKPTQFNTWFTYPSVEACGACHDDVNFATGANHPGGVATNDTCAKCHQPDSGADWDASIKAAHAVPAKARQLKGLTATIVSVKNALPGKSPTVVFAIKNGDGTPVDGTKLNSFSPMFNGPTTSYVTQPVRESGLATGTNPGTYDPATGTTSFTFKGTIPATATGTFVFAADAYRNVTAVRNDGKTTGIRTWAVPFGTSQTIREAVFNPIKYVAVTGTTVTPRRTVVATANCQTCHDQLGFHGGQRQTTEECVICHNPAGNDASHRTAGDLPESISFQRFIHRIHTGDKLTQQFAISGTSFNDVRFPGLLTDCAKCHTGTSYTLPLQQTGIASVATPRDYFSPQGPGTAACLGCHDNSDAAAHAYLNTTTFGGTTPTEACATCHGTGKDWDVAKEHAQ